MADQPESSKDNGNDEFKIELELPIDEEKVRQIQECLKKGKLKISLSSETFAAGGRAAGPYIYD